MPVAAMAILGNAAIAIGDLRCSTYSIPACSPITSAGLISDASTASSVLPLEGLNRKRMSEYINMIGTLSNINVNVVNCILQATWRAGARLSNLR